MNTPDPIDVHVGKRLRQRRTLLGMSQEKLATALGITFQQVQKYESGANRVGASRLFHIGKVLTVPVGFFFEGYKSAGFSSGDMPLAVAEEQKSLDDDVLTRKETLDLVRTYYAIENETLRRKMLDMMKSAGATASK